MYFRYLRIIYNGVLCLAVNLDSQLGNNKLGISVGGSGYHDLRAEQTASYKGEEFPKGIDSV